MFAMQYSHRLPAEHDLDAIRQRAAAKGPQWDAWPGLACKAFDRPARALYREELPLPGRGAAALRDGALAAGEALLGREDVLAVWLVADLQRWRLLRFSVSAGALELRADSVGYEVLYLARPGLERLP